MSWKGKVAWEVFHKTSDCLWKLAVGKGSFYYVYRSPSLRRQYFCGRSLKDGSVIFQQTSSLGPDCLDNQLKLLGSDKWAAVGNGSTKISLHDTTSGVMVHSFCPDRWPIFHHTEAKYWEVQYACAGGLKPCYKSTYDANNRIWTREDLLLLLSVTRASSIVPDPDHQLCFCIRSDPSSYIIRLSVAPLTVLDAVHDDGTRVLGLARSSSFVTVTLLPSAVRRNSTRSKLQFRLSAAMLWGGGFSKNTGDFIILPYPAGKKFLVLDFWPNW